MMFVKNTYHYNLYNFIFVNFNYTELLDNYIYLDKSQFEPHRHKNADRNFTFFPNPDGKLTEFNEDTSWSSYIMTNIIHPHGRQNIPRSMIFGTELENYDKSKAEKRLIKSYWAQDDLKYKRYFKDTELFIIYGIDVYKRQFIDRLPLEAGCEGYVIQGRCANFAFQGRDDVVSVFLTANDAFCVDTVADTHGVSVRKAKTVVRETNDNRKTYHKYYTGQEWGQAENYDLCLNVAKLGVDGVIAMIDSFIQNRK